MLILTVAVSHPSPTQFWQFYNAKLALRSYRSELRGSGCCCRRQVRERKSEQQASTPEGSASQLASRLCAFLKGHAGRRCSSQQLVAHFKPDGINPTLFKEVLKQVATKDDGAWVLKEDFENGS